MLGLWRLAICTTIGFSYALASNENESGNKARIKQVNLEDIPKELTAEERKMLEEVAKRPVVFDEDCPELTEDELKQFRSVLHFGR